MKTKQKYRYGIVAILIIVLSSCNKYLDVVPKSSVSEEEIFSSEVGFQQALSGVYSSMTSRALYGDNLTMGFVSALAQNYTSTNVNAPFYNTAAYRYNTAEVQNKVSAIWLSSYTAIASLNNILKFVEINRAVLSTQGYHLIKGEALALRAYLHFELLRLFGHSYIVGADNLAIPYRTTIDQLSENPISVTKVLDFILSDLDESTKLLKEKDPILSNTLERQFRMNYFAVKGLEARVKIYKDDKDGAYRAAKEVVDSEKFPFVMAASVSNPAATRNRLFKSELVFALRIRDMNYARDNYFSFLGTTATRLTRSQANFNTLYEISAGNSTDIRYNYLIETDGGSPFPSKFWQTVTGTTLDSNRLDKMMPMIRLSEMYYILAESAPTLSEGLGHLNEVRRARAIPILEPTSITPSYLRSEITKEYQKEFYAEGQLFYYYKRLNATSLLFLTTAFDINNYVLPIPDDEQEFNPNY